MRTVTYRLVYLNTFFQLVVVLSGIAMETLGNVTLLDKGHHWGQVFRVDSLTYQLAIFTASCAWSRCERSASCFCCQGFGTACCYVILTTTDSRPLEPQGETNFLLFAAFGHNNLFQQQKTNQYRDSSPCDQQLLGRLLTLSTWLLF